MLRTLIPLILGTALAVPATAQVYLAKPRMVGGNSGPAYNYVCPNVEKGTAMDCYFDAVRHLYTMCKHVKSIEIIEYGIEKSSEGTNATKTEYCIDKQKGNIARPYEVALREVAISKESVVTLKGLHAYWIESLAGLRWVPGETDEDYNLRTGMVHPVLDERIDEIRIAVEEAREKSSAPRMQRVKGK